MKNNDFAARHTIWIASAALLISATATVGSQRLPSRDHQVRDPQVRDPQVRDPIARDQRRQTGTAAIAGSVVSDESSPQPLRGVRVTISSSDLSTTRTAYTDAAGRFAFDGLPAHRYTLQATKPGWVRMSFGARGPDRPGTPITVGDAAKVTDLALRLPRGAVIAGRITDEHGLPAYGAQVRVLQYRMIQGQRTLTAVLGGTPFGETADDRGMFRIYGLAPGEYVVMATPRVSMAGEVQAMTDAEIRAALQALQQPQQPGTSSAPSAGTPAPERDMGTTVTYAQVFYPGTTSAANATAITVGPGEERTGVDFSLQLVRTARVEGTISGPAGVPLQSVQMMMLPKGDTGMPFGPGPATTLLRTTPNADGKFTYNAVPPGQYTISARATTSGGQGAGRGNVETFRFSSSLGADGERVTMVGGESGPAYWAQIDVTVDGQRLSDLGLALQPGMKVSGKIEFRGTRAIPPGDLTRVRVSMLPAAGPGMTTIMLGVPAAQVDPAGGFTFDGVTPGRYRISAVVPSPPGAAPGPQWTLKSVVVKGRDVLDFPLEIGPNETIADALVTFTDVTQELSGSLQDPSGRPAPDYTIVVFPADQQFWSVTRRIRTTRPGTDGKFTLTGLPPGEYRMAAVVDVAPSEAADPAFLEQLVPASYQFTLGEGEKKQQDLRVARQP